MPGGLAFACAVATADATQVLQIHYQVRPPFSEVRPDGSIAGVLADPTSAALKRAGVVHHWQQTPGQRQLLLIQAGEGWHCGLGWFRLPEREGLGKFSKPIYRDRPFVALTREDSPVVAGSSPAALLASAGTVLLAKEGYSYGAVLDNLLLQHPGAVRRTTAESTQMVRMILARRADWMLITPDEAGPLLQQLGPGAGEVRMRPLGGVPAGNQRYLYCSRAVPDGVIDAFNRALTEIHPTPP